VISAAQPYNKTTTKEKAMTTTLTMNDRLVELGVLGYQEDKSIQRKGAVTVDLFFKEYEKDTYEPTDETTAKILHYLTDIQVRDYALGLICIYDTKQILDALNFLLDQAPTDTAFINAPACLLATLLYERGDSASATITLTNAEGHYALAQLLTRVFKAGWPAGSFAAMSQELHPKVVAGIFDEDYEVPEAGDPADAGIDGA
jgi:hypothetical protein